MALKAPDRARCTQALDDLLRRCDSISVAMLALRDGRPYVERPAAKVAPGKFAAMASSLVALGHSVLRELGAGTLDHVLVDGSEGKLVVSSVPGSNGLLILALLARHDARLGLVLGHAKSCANAISATFADERAPA
ncbi:MAG: hypothetical protein GXC76_15810 [Rhodanobacteraceae bacterium]|jgi:hypothetical protein|nr:hypothetical protein [Rhodanobacteraceae bacterium]